MIIRASSLNQAYYCPGYPALAARTETGTDATREGTRLHELLAAWVEEAMPNEWPGEISEFVGWFNDEVRPTLERPDLICAESEAALGVGGYTLTGHRDAVLDSAERVTVIDWKTGQGQKWTLPPIAEDLQMLAYAVLSGTDRPVRPMRVRYHDHEVDELTLDAAGLEAARSFVCSVCEDIAASPEVRTPGPHCGSCLCSSACPEFYTQIEASRAALIPYSGGGQLSVDQLTRWALARGAVKARAKQLDWALRLALEGGAEIVCDGRQLRLVGSGTQDKIVNAMLVIGHMSDYLGDEPTALALSTSKSAIERACKSAGASAQDLLDKLRAAGALVEEPAAKQMRWGKL